MLIKRLRYFQFDLLAAVITLFFIAGCALNSSSKAVIETNKSIGSGRLALTVQTEPVQHFYAGFELFGHRHQGDLKIINPLGLVSAELHWQPQLAWIREGDQQRNFANPNDMIRHLLQLDAEGSGEETQPLPLDVMFDWLQGTPTQLPGWELDASALAEGKLLARRLQPQTPATLKILLTRP